ncbi:MAG: histidinol-phosphate transaminase [Geminicoccaceae bacterium]
MPHATASLEPEHVSMAGPAAYIPPIAVSVVKPAAAGTRIRFDLSLNESVWGASPKAQAAVVARAQALERYPDPASTALRRAIGQAYGLDPDRIVCGNGSEELLDVIGRLYARAGDEILLTRYGFVQFPIVAMRTGATPVTAPEDGLDADVDALLAAVTPRTRVLFLANPNNPTGTWIGRDALVRLRDGLPDHVVLVIDSAYAEFAPAESYDDGHGLVGERENVIVTRTFSKAFGLAALRVGWAHAAPATAAVMNRMRGIGNVNALAQAGAIAALEDRAFTAAAVARTIEARERLAGSLRQLGLEVPPSATNFLLVRFPAEPGRDVASAHAALLADGILTRRVDDYGLADWLRISVGDQEQVDAVLVTLGRLLA